VDFLESLSEQLAAVIAHSPAWAPLAAFLGGALTALNPCVLAMVPLMVGFSAGLVGRGASERPWRRTLGFSLLFVGGFALELALLFTVFSGATAILGAPWWRYVLAGVCAITALHLLGWLNLPSIPLPPAATRAAGALGALMLGFIFGVISLPCTGPVLLLLLGLVPRIGAAGAGGLLFAYGLGHSLLLLVAGTSVGAAAALARPGRLQTATRWVRVVAAILILAGGAWVLTH
jgi:cytochrome c biogenesis protein CcdA